MGATCPHAGGPLAEGVRARRAPRLPLAQGDLLPAHRRAARAARRGPASALRCARRRGRAFSCTCRRGEPDIRGATADPRCFVIVGAGAAGAVAAQTLREAGFGGRIVMLDRENRVPYDRTLLSKYALSGEKGGGEDAAADASPSTASTASSGAPRRWTAHRHRCAPHRLRRRHRVRLRCRAGRDRRRAAPAAAARRRTRQRLPAAQPRRCRGDPGAGRAQRARRRSRRELHRHGGGGEPARARARGDGRGQGDGAVREAARRADRRRLRGLHERRGVSSVWRRRSRRWRATRRVRRVVLGDGERLRPTLW